MILELPRIIIHFPGGKRFSQDNPLRLRLMVLLFFKIPSESGMIENKQRCKVPLMSQICPRDLTEWSRALIISFLILDLVKM